MMVEASRLEELKSLLRGSGFEYYIANINEGKSVSDDKNLAMKKSQVVTINVWIGD